MTPIPGPLDQQVHLEECRASGLRLNAEDGAPRRLDEMLSKLWHSNQATIVERLTALREAHDGMAAPARHETARIAGRDAAHKLAGVLGTFGLPQGSELASRVEALLDQPQHSAGDAKALHCLIEELAVLISAKS